jgi:cobaltochelatase CobT
MPNNSELHHQRIEELCAATVRSLSANANIHYRGRQLYHGKKTIPIFAPHMQLDPSTIDFNDYRALTDATALRIQHNNPALHLDLCPEDPIERLIFELLEQLRVETFAPNHLPGMQSNLQRRFLRWSREFFQSGLADTSLGILLFTLSQMCWSRLSGKPVLPESEDAIEATRAALGPLLGKDLASLKRHRQHQMAYAVHARAIAALAAKMIHTSLKSEKINDEDDSKKLQQTFKLILSFIDEGEHAIASSNNALSNEHNKDHYKYRVFSRHYDKHLQAETLARKEQLAQFRQTLDKEIHSLGINVSRLSRQLRQVLALPLQDGYSFGQEQGLIDGRRLSQLISSPSERRLFLGYQNKPKANCRVSFLIDCSGSMKTHINAITQLVDVFCRALDQIDVCNEILGFTTGAWNGGRVKKEWLNAGQPSEPGRLNELCYITFKSLKKTWRKSKLGICALLKGDLFREAIDGEAIDWACNHILSSEEHERRILIVISDGSPMDSATHQNNDPSYLDKHLMQVVAQREAENKVEIYALGVGLDLSTVYSRSLALDITSPLDHEVFYNIAQLLSGGHRR